LVTKFASFSVRSTTGWPKKVSHDQMIKIVLNLKACQLN